MKPVDRAPRCFSLLIVKNEDDIVERSIQHLSSFSEKVFVLDNGSSDRTGEIVSGLRSDKVVDLGVYRHDFFINMRKVIWQLVRSESMENDWWHFADVDEFMADDVGDFLRRVPLSYGVVMKADIYPVPVPSQRDAFFRTERFDEGFFTHYFRSDWSEPRFFRNTRRLCLHPETLGFSRLRAVFPKPIRAVHYHWRSRPQVEKRIQTLQETQRRVPGAFAHRKQQRLEDIFGDVKVKNAIPMDGEIVWPTAFRNWNPHAPRSVLSRQARKALYHLGLV